MGILFLQTQIYIYQFPSQDFSKRMFPCRLWEQLPSWLFDSREEWHTGNNTRATLSKLGPWGQGRESGDWPSPGQGPATESEGLLKILLIFVKRGCTHIILIFHLFRHWFLYVPWPRIKPTNLACWWDGVLTTWATQLGWELGTSAPESSMLRNSMVLTRDRDTLLRK